MQNEKSGKYDRYNEVQEKETLPARIRYPLHKIIPKEMTWFFCFNRTPMENNINGYFWFP